MRKIKLEEISPYLPYGLRCQIPKHRIRYGQQEILVLNGMSLTSEKELNPEFLLTNDDLLFGTEIKWWKPVVRPLSDLTKIITEDGEPEMCVLEIIFGSRYRYAWQGRRPWEMNPILWKWYETQKLFEYHFDVFNWLKDGLAVNINEL